MRRHERRRNGHLIPSPTTHSDRARALRRLARVPEGVDEANVRSRLLQEYQLEVGAGLGALAGKVRRIGLMGHSCNPKNVLLCVGAFETILASEGAAMETGVAEAAAQTAFAS